MSRALDALSPVLRPLACELIARCAEQGIPLVIVCTGRTSAEQAAAVASGQSWVAVSRHQTGDAIDVCPYAQYDAHGPDKLLWDGGDPIWTKVGLIGEALGLRWGGRWRQQDLGHFEVRG